MKSVQQSGLSPGVLLEHVRKERDGYVILDDVSLSVGAGEIVGIHGSNGAGKSTLLEIMAGLYDQDSGTVDTFGLDSDEIDTGFVFQHSSASLFPWLSAAENAAFPLRAKGAGTEERRAAVEEMALGFGWQIPMEHPPHRMSGGEQQKVNILRSLIAKPQIVFFDEPTSDLDESSRKQFLRELQRLAAECRMTVFFISHDLEELVFLADKILHLSSNGARLGDGDAIELKCPWPRPRPISWLTETSFDDALIATRHELSKLPE
jgi:NitT/TauT family transport system ATP-binding protein